MYITKIVTGPEEREINGPLKPPLWNGSQPGTRVGQIYYDASGALDGTAGPIYWDGAVWKKYGGASFISSASASYSAAQRVGNTLTGIVDRYTGEYLAFNKVTTYADGSAMTDAKVDGVMYVKLGTEYFLREAPQGVNIQWWGAVGDGVANDSVACRSCFDLIGLMGGGKIIIPAGTFLISRRSIAPFDMVKLSSNMQVEGAGMGKTILKLLPSDLLNFRRMFIVDPNANVSNIEISHLGIDMSNTFTTYPPSDTVNFPDAQNAGIFLFSNTFVISNVYLHDLLIYSVTGDCIGISKNAQNVSIERIYQRDYLRQGISIGGSGGVNNISVKQIYDLPFLNGVIKGGNSIHCEPAVAVSNLNYSDCVVSDFSASNVLSGSIDKIVTSNTSSTATACNNVQNFNISKCTLAGKLQVSPSGDNVAVSNNDLAQGLVLTSVGGVGLRSTNNISINNNEILSAVDEAIKVDNIDGVMITANNIIHSNNTGIYIANALTGRIADNKIRTTGNFYSIYCAITVSANFGAGFFTVFDNEVYNSYRPISGNNTSMVVGPNAVYGAVIKIYPQGTYTKYFPHTNGYGQVLTHNVFPTWGEYNVGDEIRVISGTIGATYKSICTRAGALHEGAWSSGGTYVINSYVLGSDNKVYKATVVSGQTIDPVTDTTNTKWVVASALAALFTGVGITGLQFAGSGSPEGVVTAPVGAEYVNTAGTAGLIRYGKQSGTGNTGWVPIW